MAGESRVSLVAAVSTAGASGVWMASVRHATSTHDVAEFLPALLRLITTNRPTSAQQQRDQHLDFVKAMRAK